MIEELENLKLQLNYVCYEDGMIDKLSKVWEAYFKIEKKIKDNPKCTHSWVKAQGIGGGYIFAYCNKCGKTVPEELEIIRSIDENN